MTDNQTTAWIFLATAIASETGPTNFNSISNIADGINHAVPTHKELQTSLTWLTNHGLVTKTGNKYCLTEKGKIDYEIASKQASTLLKVWNNVEATLMKYRN